VKDEIRAGGAQQAVERAQYLTTIEEHDGVLHLKMVAAEDCETVALLACVVSSGRGPLSELIGVASEFLLSLGADPNLGGL
jgi:hypothetical protein